MTTPSRAGDDSSVYRQILHPANGRKIVLAMFVLFEYRDRARDRSGRKLSVLLLLRRRRGLCASQSDRVYRRAGEGHGRETL